MLKYIFWIVFLSCFYGSFATSVIKEGKKETVLTHQPYFIFEDINGTHTIDYLIANPHVFEKSTKILPENDNNLSTYWVKFPIIDSSSINTKWFIELYNFRIDSLDIYEVYKGKILKHTKAGDHLLFRKKEIPHKNFAYMLPQIKNDTIFYYIKAKSERRVDFYTVVKSVDFFVGYSNGEYFLLGMLYGILSIMLLYNLFYFLVLRERLYFFYLCSTVGFLIYFMAKDGSGFQYLWNSYPEINDMLPSISICFAMINQLLFTWDLFKNDHFDGKMKTTLLVLVSLRLLYFVVGIVFFSDTELLMIVDVPLVLFMLWVGIKNYNRGELGTAYFPLGTFLFLLGYFITAIFELNVIPHSTFAVYASSFGVVAQIVMYWGCLGYRQRQATIKKKLAEYQLQLKQMEVKTLETYQDELEAEVNKATESIKNKNQIIKRTNQNLETFIYKSSHNLKSPLRNIIGLFNLSRSEADAQTLKDLFEHVGKSAAEMDRELALVAKASEINTHQVLIASLNLYEFVENVFEHTEIEVVDFDKSDFETQGDLWLLNEGLIYLKQIVDRLNTQSTPKLKLWKENHKYCFQVSFKADKMKQSYAEQFFTPFQKEIGHVFGLYFEPYLCQTIMDKLRGRISMKLNGDQVVEILVESAV